MEEIIIELEGQLAERKDIADLTKRELTKFLASESVPTEVLIAAFKKKCRDRTIFVKDRVTGCSYPLNGE